MIQVAMMFAQILSQKTGKTKLIDKTKPNPASW